MTAHYGYVAAGPYPVQLKYIERKPIMFWYEGISKGDRVVILLQAPEEPVWIGATQTIGWDSGQSSAATQTNPGSAR